MAHLPTRGSAPVLDHGVGHSDAVWATFTMFGEGSHVFADKNAIYKAVGLQKSKSPLHLTGIGLLRFQDNHLMDVLTVLPICAGA